MSHKAEFEDTELLRSIEESGVGFRVTSSLLLLRTEGLLKRGVSRGGSPGRLQEPRLARVLL